MNKEFQDFESIFESAARCLSAGIRPSFNIIFAYPGEGIVERSETVRFMMDMCRRFPGAEFWTNIFTPYPGAPIMEKAHEIGIRVPTSLEGWSDFFPRYTPAGWMVLSMSVFRSCATIFASLSTGCPLPPIGAGDSPASLRNVSLCPHGGDSTEISMPFRSGYGLTTD